MSALSIQPTYPIFTDIDGQPLEDGYVWIGAANLDPQTNPINVYWDAALTLPAAQPIRTLAGYPANSGTPARLYVDSDYSIRVMNKNGSVVYSAPAATERYSGVVVQVDASQVTFTQDGAGAVQRTVEQKLNESVSVLDFGADNSGATDAAPAIQLALNSGAKRIYAPAGTYKILSTLTIPKNVSLEGDGIGATIFDGSSATYSNLTGGTHIQTASGTLTKIQDLATNANLGDLSITLTATPSLNVNDIICIYNPTDFSWSPERYYYRAGEWARVASVAGSIVGLQGGLADGYIAANVDVYRLDNPTSLSLRGFTLKGLKNTASAVFGIQVINAVDSSIEDVRVWNCSYTGISLSQCFNVQISSCSVQEDLESTLGGDYGLAIGNSQVVNVVGGYFSASRHAITTGGGADIGDVTNRYITIDGATMTSTGAAQAADFHANTEYSGFYNCVANPSMVIGGNYIEIKNNIIRGGDVQGVAIYCTPLRGANLNIEGNTIWSDTHNASSTFPLHLLIAYIGGRVVVGGTTTVKNNSFIWQGNVAQRDCVIIRSSITNGEKINVEVDNNTFSSTSQTRLQTAVLFQNASDLYTPFESLAARGNRSNCGGIWLFDNSSFTTARFKQVIINDNDLSGGYNYGIVANHVGDLAEVKANTVKDFWAYGILINNILNAQPVKYAEISNNTIINCQLFLTGSGITNTGASIVNADFAIIKDNSCHNNNQYIEVASVAGFAVGDTVTGASSGATGIIKFISGVKLSLGTSISGGPFTIGETVNAAPSGASSTVTVVDTYAVSYSVGLQNITSAYVARNADTRNLNVYRTSITGYIQGSQWDITPSTYNPPSMIDGSGLTVNLSTTIGISPGDLVQVSFSNDLQGVLMTGYVSATDTPTARFQNETGGTIDLASGTLAGKVTKV